MVLLITAGVVVVGLLGGTLRNLLLSTGFLAAVLALNVLLLGWRGLSIWNAGTAPRWTVQPNERRVALGTVLALLVLTLVMHGWVGIVVTRLEGTLDQVFDGPTTADADAPAATPDNDGDTTGGAGEEPINAPDYRWDGRERINILLIGTDAAPGREQILTDVILVVSVDPVERSAVMISVPRDTGYLPLPDESIYADGVFPRKANELAAVASADAERWCSEMSVSRRLCGIRALERSVGLYVGLEIHHYAVVDMAGFAALIDAVGGLELCLPGRLVDPEFDGTLSNTSDGRGIELPGGCAQYDGLDALAYARSRQGWIEMPDGTLDFQTDFDRNERQQRLLLALREELAQADLVFELPSVLEAIGRTVTSDFPRDRAGDLASLLPLIAGPDIERVVLGYPEYVDAPLDPDANYLLIPRRAAIREEMSRLFGADALRGWYLATDAATPSAADDGSEGRWQTNGGPGL